MILGIGAWWDPLAKRVGIDRSRPLKAMRETVARSIGEEPGAGRPPESSQCPAAPWARIA